MLSQTNETIMICGDPHGQFDHILQAAKDHPSCPVILLGDLALDRPIEQVLEPIWERVLWIHGNHDTDMQIHADSLWTEAAHEKWIHTRVVELPSGMTVGGLGGIFRKEVWKPGNPFNYVSRQEHADAVGKRKRWNGGPPMKSWSSIYPEDIEMMMNQKCDLLVTHEAPGYHRHGAPIIDDVALIAGAKCIVHAHHHEDTHEPKMDATRRPHCVGVGLRGVTMIGPDWAVERLVPGQCEDIGERAERYERAKIC